MCLETVTYYTRRPSPTSGPEVPSHPYTSWRSDCVVLCGVSHKHQCRHHHIHVRGYAHSAGETRHVSVVVHSSNCIFRQVLAPALTVLPLRDVMTLHGYVAAWVCYPVDYVVSE